CARDYYGSSYAAMDYW
nr:immunoglobulin heavy chain junction region [Mus musculus]MBK4196950.1 immunoglobulin heavy chain junction region [Mus musculus]MBK4196951.1 immunoglobulin heavy chain junction region [Mus musculus]MBK4196952.1 immunoglobulin heavy chain junction region [Mus musculus]